MNAPTPPSTAAFSSSESLARGLALGLLRQWEDCEQAHRERLKAKRKKRGLSKLPRKRGPLYRMLCQRTRGLVPKEQFIAEAYHGDPSGMDRRSGYAVLHWTPVIDRLAIELTVMYARPDWRQPRSWCLLKVTQHALRRLFYRLKTLDPSAVFGELMPAVALLIQWYGTAAGLAPRSQSIGLPTPGGVLVVVLDERPVNPVVGRPDGLVGATWISTARMQHDPERLLAIQSARDAGGLVVQHGGEHIAIGPADAAVLAPHLEAWTDPYFDEMLALLPAASAIRGP